MGISVWDYGRWRKAETEKYGQGPEGAGYKLEANSYKLDRVYQNKKMGVRIRYPSELVVKENKDQVEFGEKIKMSVRETNQNLVDVADEEADKLKLTREREYVNAGPVAITILTWEEGGETRQRALTVNGKTMIVIDAAAGEEGVLRAMLESLVII